MGDQGCAIDLSVLVMMCAVFLFEDAERILYFNFLIALFYFYSPGVITVSNLVPTVWNRLQLTLQLSNLTF